MPNKKKKTIFLASGVFRLFRCSAKMYGEKNWNWQDNRLILKLHVYIGILTCARRTDHFANVFNVNSINDLISFSGHQFQLSHYIYFSQVRFFLKIRIFSGLSESENRWIWNSNIVSYLLIVCNFQTFIVLIQYILQRIVSEKIYSMTSKKTRAFYL